MLTKERIEQLAQKFNKNYYIASQRYNEPKCAFAAVLTVVEVIEEVIEEMKSDEKFKEILEAQREVERALGLKGR